MTVANVCKYLYIIPVLRYFVYLVFTPPGHFLSDCVVVTDR